MPRVDGGTRDARRCSRCGALKPRTDEHWFKTWCDRIRCYRFSTFCRTCEPEKRPPQRGKSYQPPHFDEALAVMEAERGPIATWPPEWHAELSQRVYAALKWPMPAPDPRVASLPMDPGSPFYVPPRAGVAHGA